QRRHTLHQRGDRQPDRRRQRGAGDARRQLLGTPGRYPTALLAHQRANHTDRPRAPAAAGPAAPAPWSAAPPARRAAAVGARGLGGVTVYDLGQMLIELFL